MIVRTRRPMAAAATIAGAAAIVIYLVLIIQQSVGGSFGDLGRVAIVTALLLTFTALSGAGALASQSRVRRAALTGAAVGWFVLGFFALFSIGILLLVAGVFTVVGLAQELAARSVSGDDR